MGDHKFKIGDVVQHKTGDFKMVILRLTEDDSMSEFGYVCQWYAPELCNHKDDYGFVEKWFNEVELEKYSKE